MALNPINILRRKAAGLSQTARASRGAGTPAVAASREAMQRRRERASEGKASQAAHNNGKSSTPAASKSTDGLNDPVRAHTGREVDGRTPASVQQNDVSATEYPADDSNGKHGGSVDSSRKDPQITPIEIVVPQHIGRYTIGGKLGSGTCGVVHKALDTVLDREVAIKLSPIGEPHLSTGKVPGAQRAYQTELYAAGRLRHPNIVTVYDAGQHNELNFMVMEAVHGRTLKHFGKGQKLLPVYRAVEVIIDCCKALDYSHAQGILHRDIKPANIMIADDNCVKLLDFGIAVGLTDEVALSRKGPTLGTPNYMSPEQILGKSLGPSSDLYSLGTVLFELVTGKQLFKARKVKDLFRTVVHQEAPRISEFRPDLPPEFSNIVEKVLRKKSQQRYQSGAELIADLQPFLEDFRSRGLHAPVELHLAKRCSQLDFFSGLAERDVLQVLDVANVIEFGAGVELLEGGNLERRLLVLLQGVVREYESGSARRLYVDGDCLGEIGFVQGNRIQSQFRTATPVEIVEISAAALAELPAQLHLSIYKRASSVLVERLSTQNAPLKPEIVL